MNMSWKYSKGDLRASGAGWVKSGSGGLLMSSFFHVLGGISFLGLLAFLVAGPVASSPSSLSVVSSSGIISGLTLVTAPVDNRDAQGKYKYK